MRNVACILFPAIASISFTSAATRCPANKDISKKYLKAVKSSKTNVFYPSAYFVGSAAKFVSATGLKELNQPQLCVDGATVSTKIALYDDGTHGDDVANDGIYSRGCVHFCEKIVNLGDIWNFAYQQNFNMADLTVVDASLKGKIPHHVVRSPKYPKARIYVTSHAAFFVDDQRYYMPTWPLDFVWDYAGARNVAVSAILDIFGDVFDWFSMTSFDFNFRYCAACKAIPGAYNIKYHGWERVGGATAFRRPGELSDCDFAMTGFPILRMVGGVSNEDMLTEFLGQIHEWLHGAAGFSYQRYLTNARKGDGMHVPGTCTSDHSQLQGPLWDWIQGYPTSVPLSYCDGIPNCYEKAYDLVRLQPNADCNTCPDSTLSTCCSFRYEDAINTRELMLSKPELYQASPLLQYIAGVLPYESIPANKKTYYCMGSDTDSGCGPNKPAGPCTTIPVNDKDRSRVTSTFVTRYTLDELIGSVGGRRDPPFRKEQAFRSAPILIGQRPPAEAEMVFWTHYWRYQEQEKNPWTRVPNTFGTRRVPLVTWSYTTNGRSTVHSRFHGVPCGGGLQVQSCSTDRTVCDGFRCGKDATCYPYDGRPLCVCNDGFWGDGNLCQRPGVSESYDKIYPYLWSAHELFYNGDAEYYPKYTVKQWCYGDQVDWPARFSPARIAPYPGGLPQYALMGCGTTVCTLAERCSQGVCVPLKQPVPTRRPTKAPTRNPTAHPTSSNFPSSVPSVSSRPSLSASPSATRVTFTASFRMASRAAAQSKRQCGCKARSDTRASRRDHAQCIKQITNNFLRADLQAGTIRSKDQDAWMAKFNRKLKKTCRRK
ncbi:hypothetical protein MPSEU_000073000 [Mayamaea pseudoterrestris]|nr:hypothetical protein MPSEU_000073000 [Mayamaea pseudoterrestris]